MKSFRIIFIALSLLIVPYMAFSQYSEDEWSERDTWMPLEIIFDAVELKKGMAVADLGCHEGYLSMHLAKRVGATGKVYAEDVRNDRLELLKEHARSRDLHNIEVILGDYNNPRLPERPLDIVFIIDTYHEMDDYMDILKHVHKALKPGGKLVILEKLKTRVKGKSRGDMTIAHSLAPKYVREEMKEAGFHIIHHNKDMGDWENDEDKTMWMLIGQKAKR